MKSAKKYATKIKVKVESLEEKSLAFYKWFSRNNRYKLINWVNK